MPLNDEIDTIVFAIIQASGQESQIGSSSSNVYVTLPHRYITELHQLALAGDQSQVIAERTVKATYCTHPTVVYTAGTACTPVADAKAYMHKYRTMLDDFESYHQGFMLGYSGLRKIDDRELFSLWNDRTINYTVSGLKISSCLH